MAKDAGDAGTGPQHLRDAPSPAFFLYVLECADGTFYTGYTVDVAARVQVHNEGAGAKYTRSRRPVRLVASASFSTQHEALSAEYRFKRLTRRQKEALIARSRTEPFETVVAEALFGMGERGGKGVEPASPPA